MTKKAFIVPIANQADAIALSISGSTGLPQSLFTAMAITNPTGLGSPTHCWANGDFEDTTIALFQAAPYAQVKEAAYRARTPAIVLAECSPQLYPWLGA